ncbi:MAG: M20/M25/M40 family metallo-hydrolase, partial [Paludibacteraceae bacterium]|nr:M20/M25/M40 family metallo-hydrolase [Paludibacteraceae bacterium]
MTIQDYINAHRARFMEEWASLIRIPSVSCQAEHKADMVRCAERWRELLLEAGCQRAEVLAPRPPKGGEGNPFVYAEYQCPTAAGGLTATRSYSNAVLQAEPVTQVPTVLVYAHYDVMPVEPVEQWRSDPWEPALRDGRLYARGADDDKGQAMIQAKAFEYMVKTGQLRCNVKFIFEGEEEIGSPSLEAFLEEHKDLLKADIILVSDTSMIGKETPSITTGLRGLAYWQIEVDG